MKAIIVSALFVVLALMTSSVLSLSIQGIRRSKQQQRQEVKVQHKQLPLQRRRHEEALTSPSPWSPSSSPSSRRGFLDKTLVTPAFLFPMTGFAVLSTPSDGWAAATDNAETTNDRDGKPFSPVEALIPATRAKLWIDEAYQISKALSSSTNDVGKGDNSPIDSSGRSATMTKYTQQNELLKELDQVLSNRPKLFVNEKPLKRMSNPTTAQITTGVSVVNKEQYQRNRQNLSLPNQVAAMFNQADVERQWGMLQYSESKREEGNELRAALNFYTQQLEFGDSYLLTASKEDRKRMIRNDQLPSLAAVITSDLDLRDLYRNQLLTAVDDVQAEVTYQLKQPPEEVDISDVVALMNQAYKAFSNWFEPIPKVDVQYALEVVNAEKIK